MEPDSEFRSGFDDLAMRLCNVREVSSNTLRTRSLLSDHHRFKFTRITRNKHLKRVALTFH